MKLPRWAILTGTIVLIVVFILFGFLWFMPKRSLGRMAQAQITKATGFQYDVQVQSAKLSGLTGVKASDIHLKSINAVSENLKPGTLDVQQLKVRAGIFSLLRGQPTVRTRIQFPTGHARILFHQDKDTRHIEAQFYDVALTDLGMLRDYARVPLRGTLRGSVEATINQKQLLTDAKIDMNILDLIVGPRTLSGSDLPQEVRNFFFGDITIPAIHAGDILIRGAMNDDGAFAIDQFVGQGDDLRISAEGQIVPKAPIKNSEMDLKLSVAIDPDWVEKAEIGMIMKSVPVISRAQQGDHLVFSITGPMHKIRFKPAAERSRLH